MAITIRSKSKSTKQHKVSKTHAQFGGYEQRRADHQKKGGLICSTNTKIREKDLTVRAGAQIAQQPTDTHDGGHTMKTQKLAAGRRTPSGG